MLKTNLLYNDYKIDSKLIKHIKEVIFIRVPFSYYYSEQEINKLTEINYYSRVINQTLGPYSILDKLKESEYSDTITLINANGTMCDHIQSIFNPYKRGFLNIHGYLTDSQLYIYNKRSYS